ncbi:DNA-binding beta-propeller fold protein YncE [Marmoricola sp. OAE513]|uniref:serine/threonine protein kinase n=1 Tax=Marmoricola sp. OAE513 TaxID=2817894 RepID=UPI001AEADDF9
MRRTAALTLFAFLAAALVADVEAGPRKASAAGAVPLRDVMLVGNNWAGTATVVDARTHKLLKTGINFVPDASQEIADIRKKPDQLAFYYLIQQGPGEGHDQYVDDMFTTNDGKYVAVSRPSFADVVWIDLAKAAAAGPAGSVSSIVREQQMDGYRTDHMGVSPDGRRLLVSDSTENQVIEYSMVDEVVGGKTIKMGDRLRSFESGETPHENNFSPDGSLIYHASIGKVYLPGDQHSLGPVKIGPLHDAIKGDRWYEIVDNTDFSIKHRWDMGKELEEAGHPGMSSAVRPMAVAPGGRFIYFQVSYFHGIVEFDTQAADLDGKVTYKAGTIPEPRTGAVTRLIDLPNRVPKMPLEEYVNDSAHHGLAINGAGTTLCAAGTMDDYVAFVDRATGTHRIFDKATTGHDYLKPYWTTEGLEDTCWVSLSDSDAVAVIDFATGEELAFLPVGDHPQRVRHGYVPESVVSTWAPVEPGPIGGPNGGGKGLINTVSALLGGVIALLNPVLPVR